MNLKTKLLEHQQKAFQKLSKITIGALFMDMGTGKTRTALEIVKKRFDEGKIDRVVWFCPVSVKKNLKEDIEKHSDAKVYEFGNRTTEGTDFSEYEIIICGIESTSSSDRVKLTLNKLMDMKTMLITDESTYIKNHRAKRSKFITDMSTKCKYKLILNGTPTTNSVEDLFQQFYFLSPKILGYSSFYTFASNHLEYDEQYPGRVVQSHNIEFLSSKIAPYTYQIKKEDCLTLPRKIHSRKYCDMSEEQKTAYEGIKEEFIYKVSFDEISDGDVFKLFTKLQQVSSAFMNAREKTGEKKVIKFKNNPKKKLLKNLAEECEGKIIIFFKFIQEIEDIVESIGKENCEILEGAMSEKKRWEAISRFKKEKRFLVANLSIGSFGLNLSEAKTVIYYSNKFNFAERLQSEDRVHRIGQNSDVQYIDLCCSGMEEKIIENLVKKERLLDKLIIELKNKNHEVLKEL